MTTWINNQLQIYPNLTLTMLMKLGTWWNGLLDEAIAIANHHGCICNMCVNMHQNTDMLIFMSVHYPPMQAFHAQYLNMDLTRLDFIDTILDSIKTSVQLGSDHNKHTQPMHVVNKMNIVHLLVLLLNHQVVHPKG